VPTAQVDPVRGYLHAYCPLAKQQPTITSLAKDLNIPLVALWSCPVQGLWGFQARGFVASPLLGRWPQTSPTGPSLTQAESPYLAEALFSSLLPSHQVARCNLEIDQGF
jgi:hypothetical protein